MCRGCMSSCFEEFEQLAQLAGAPRMPDFGPSCAGRAGRCEAINSVGRRGYAGGLLDLALRSVDIWSWVDSAPVLCADVLPADARVPVVSFEPVTP